MATPPRCLACREVSKNLTFTRICKDCTENIVTVLEAMEREVRGLKQDYQHAFEMLNEEDERRMGLVLSTHEGIKELIYSRVRTEATAKFHTKIEKTIARGGEFADALQLWYDYIELEQRFRDVQFNTIAIKNKQLEEWFREYAKRKDR